MQFGTARQSHHGEARGVERGDERCRRRLVAALRIAPRERQAVAPDELKHAHRGLGRTRADDLEADALDLLERFPPRDERRQHEVAERLVIEQERSQLVAVDGDVAESLRHGGSDEHGLPGQEIELAQEVRRPVVGELVAGGVENRDLSLQDHDERVALIAHAVEHVADVRRALFAKLGQRRELRRRKRWARRRNNRIRGTGHATILCVADVRGTPLPASCRQLKRIRSHGVPGRASG